MSYAEDLVNSIANAKKMGGKDRLAEGNHRLALLTFTRVKNQKAGKSGPFRLQAMFEVVSSDVYKPGNKASVSFFVERPEYPEYEHDRAKMLLEALGQCVSETRGLAALGGEVMGHGQRGRGIVIDCQITPDRDEHGNPKKGPKGNTYTSEAWVAIPQTWENVAEARAQLDQTYGVFNGEGAIDSAPPAAPAPAPQSAPPQGWSTPGTPAPQGGSLLRRGG